MAILIALAADCRSTGVGSTVSRRPDSLKHGKRLLLLHLSGPRTPARTRTGVEDSPHLQAQLLQARTEAGWVQGSPKKIDVMDVTGSSSQSGQPRVAIPKATQNTNQLRLPKDSEFRQHSLSVFTNL